MRISIIGQSSSGKSTFAQNISKKLNIPHIQLDDFYLESRGHRLKSGESRTNVREHMRENVVNFVSKNDWVSDGFYSKVQPIIAERAEYIFF